MEEDKNSVKEPLRNKTEDKFAKDIEDAYRDLDQGWSWVVMFASFGCFCLIGGTMYAVGIIHSTLLERFHKNVSLTSWAGALHSALISAGGPLSSALIDRFSCRTALIASGASYVVGYLATAFAPTLEVAIFTCGIVAGFGGAFGYTASMVVVGFNFHKRRNIALGIAVSGVGVGLFVMAPIMQMSRAYYGTSGFFFILAAMSANIITFAVLCFPSKLELSAQMKRRHEAKKLKEVESKSCASLRNYTVVACNKAIICLCFSMFNFCLGTFLIYLHLPTYIEVKGFSQTEASIIVSISGVLAVVGRILTGVLANLKSVNDIFLYSGSMAVVSLGTFLLPLYSASFIGQVAYAVILGLFFGSCYVVMTAINIKFVGVNYMSAATGLEFFFGGIGALIGPVIAGIIVDSGGTYDQSFIVAAFCIFLATVLSATTYCFASIDDQEPVTRELVIESQEKIKNSLTSITTYEEISKC